MRKERKDWTIILLACFTVISILGISIGYSALNTNLTLSGDAHVRVNADIRITDLKMIEATNGAYETYNSKYSKDTISTYITLPNLDSTIIYEGIITNRSDNLYSIEEIIEESKTNELTTYTFTNLSIGNVIKPHSSKKFTIEFTTKDSNQIGDLVLKYLFQKVEQTVFAYDYTGASQEFIAPYSGNYQLEVWGAQGGNASATYYGGYGAYSSGTAQLKQGESIYITVGGQGKSCNGKGIFCEGGYNDGGSAKTYITVSSTAGGGGATHISLEPGLLSTLENKINRILIVAGAGGGGHYTNESNFGVGGNGGGYTGSMATNTSPDKNYPGRIAYPGNQTSGGCNTVNLSCGLFGSGGNSIDAPDNHNGAGGGGGSGFYGGGAAVIGPGAGGSGYIASSLLTNKKMYCYNCQQSSDTETRTVSTTNVSNTPISNYAKKGNGYAKITFITE